LEIRGAGGRGRHAGKEERAEGPRGHVLAQPSATRLRISSARRPASSAVRPSVETGEWITIVTLPGLMRSRPRGTSVLTPARETGTTGTPASRARTKLPRLKR